MLRILRYELPRRSGPAEVIMPFDAEILTIQIQHGFPMLWVLCDPNATKVTRHFGIYLTGGEKAFADKYIATLQFDGGDYVLHYFEME